VPKRLSRLYLGGSTLIGFDHVCPNGYGSPPKIPDKEIEYYVIGLVVKDPTTLTFAITPGHVQSLEGRFVDVIQGCASFFGELRLSGGA
jgi:hypothetical protein